MHPFRGKMQRFLPPSTVAFSLRYLLLLSSAWVHIPQELKEKPQYKLQGHRSFIMHFSASLALMYYHLERPGNNCSHASMQAVKARQLFCISK